MNQIELLGTLSSKNIDGHGNTAQTCEKTWKKMLL